MCIYIYIDTCLMYIYIYIYIYIYTSHIHMYMWRVLTKWVVCQNKTNWVSHTIGKKIQSDFQSMNLSHTQPKLLNAEHAWRRTFQTEKNTLEVRSHVSTQSSTLSFQNQLFCCFRNKLPSHVCCRRYIMLTVYWNYYYIIRVFSNVF